MAQSLVPHCMGQFVCLTLGYFVPVLFPLCAMVIPQCLCPEISIPRCCVLWKLLYFYERNWKKKRSNLMENEKFKHKLQEPLDWQLHQQLLTLPKQKPVGQRPWSRCGHALLCACLWYEEWGQNCDKWAYGVCRIPLFLIYCFFFPRKNKHTGRRCMHFHLRTEAQSLLASLCERESTQFLPPSVVSYSTNFDTG